MLMNRIKWLVGTIGLIASCTDRVGDKRSHGKRKLGDDWVDKLKTGVSLSRVPLRGGGALAD